MKYTLLLISTILLFNSNLHAKKSVYPKKIDGFVFIPSGSCTPEGTTYSIHAMFMADHEVTNGEYLKIALPLHHRKEAVTLVPIDAIFQDEKTTSILVLKDDKAVAKTITLGNLYGSFAEITSGVNEDDRIILSRAVIAGDSVSAQ